MSRRRVVVTGSEGFVGRHLRATLVARAVEVIGVGRPGSGAEVEVDLAERDLDVGDLVRDVGPVDGVIWLAATITRGSSVGREARENVRVIAQRAAEWMEAAHALGPGPAGAPPHFVFCSSLKIYGPSAARIDPEDPPRQPDPWSYGCAKALGERLLDVAAARCGATWCAVRPSYVYGPGQHLHNAIPRFLAACWRGQAPVVFGEGREIRDDVFVGDVAEVLAEACLRRATGAFHAASGQEATLLAVARGCCRAVEDLGGPAGLEPVLDRSRPPRWWLDQTFDVSRTERLLGVRATPLAEGLRATASWVRDVARAEEAPGRPAAAAPDGANGARGAGPVGGHGGVGRRVVVVGASTPLGRQVELALARRGHAVVALGEGDAVLAEDRAVEDVAPHLGPDVVLVHLPWRAPSGEAAPGEARRALLELGVLGTMRLLEACRERGAARVVLAATVAPPGALPRTDAEAAEGAIRDLLRVFGEETGVPCVVVPPGETGVDGAAAAIVAAAIDA